MFGTAVQSAGLRHIDGAICAKPTQNSSKEGGVEYRFNHDKVDGTVSLVTTPNTANRDTDLITGFLQDTITIVPEKWTLMLGSKFEHNDFTGFEAQPSGRLAWTPNDRNTVWTSVSRAVRTPARIDSDLVFTPFFADTGLLMGFPPSGVLIPMSLTGDPDNKSEVLLAYELGFRTKVTDQLTLDVAGFFNDYDKLILPTAIPGLLTNTASAETWGVEAAATWRAAENLRIEGSYSFLHVHSDASLGDVEENSPANQGQIRAYLDVTDDLELNGAAYYVDVARNAESQAYIRLDVGLTWRPTENLEVSVWGQNLLDEGHVEFNNPFIQDALAEVQRGVYGQVTLRF